MDGFSDLILIIVLAVVLLLVIEGSHRRRWRSGWYGPTYVYPVSYTPLTLPTILRVLCSRGVRLVRRLHR